MHIHEKEYRYTSKPNTLYITAFHNTSSHKLEALKSLDPLSIKNVSILGSSTPVNFAIQGEHFILSHETSPFYLARIYKVELQ